MNRGLTEFLGFCAFLIVISALVVWWLGWPMVNLALFGARDDQPYYLLYFRHAAPAAAATGVTSPGSAASYDGQFLRLLAQADVSLLWRGAELEVLRGSVTDEWAQVDVTGFASSRSFVRLATSSDYREVRRLVPQGTRLALGTADAPLVAADLGVGGSDQFPHQLLLLAQTFDRAAIDAWLTPLRELGGEVLWDAQVGVLEGGSASNNWNTLLVVGFADTPQFQGWVHSLSAQTNLAVLASKSQAVNLWLIGSLRH